MQENRLLKLLETKKVLLADGATGTNLFDVGLEAGDAPEIWNLTNADKIIGLHQSFVDAGSDIILTNSFGGNRKRLMLHNFEDRVEELNIEAAKLARQVADQSGRDIAVGGSIGPTGELLEPLGLLTEEEAVEVFYEQALALKKGGVDVIWIETMSSLEELNTAVLAAKKTGLPVVATMSFDTNAHTMMGVSPKAFSDYQKNELKDSVLAIGCNCGVGSDETLEALLEMGNEIILVAKANCGVPEYKEGSIQYSGTISSMANYTEQAVKQGIRIIGGCCGTSPQHLKAMRKAIDDACVS